MDLFRRQTAFLCADTPDGEKPAGHCDFRSKGAGYRQGALVVSAGGVAAKPGRAFREGGGHNGPLGKAFGAGHGKGLGLYKAEPTVQGLLHGFRGPLARGGGFFFA